MVVFSEHLVGLILLLEDDHGWLVPAHNRNLILCHLKSCGTRRHLILVQRDILTGIRAYKRAFMQFFVSSVLNKAFDGMSLLATSIRLWTEQISWIIIFVNLLSKK